MALWNEAQWNGGAAAPLPRTVTATSLGYDAYRALGVLRAGQSASPEMLDDAHRAVNDMVDQWNTERLNIFAIRRDVYDLTAGQTAFTLGDLEETGTRPQKIVAAGILSSGATSEQNLPILTLEQHRAGQSGIYTDNAFPYAGITITLPTAAAGDQLVLHSWQELSGFADLETSYNFPAGYAAALKWNLALELAPAARIYAKISDVLYSRIEANARSAKAKIKRANMPTLLLRVDDALLAFRGSR